MIFPFRKTLFTVITLAGLCASPSTFSASVAGSPARCPDVASLQRIALGESDLIEKKPPREECCNADGRPYHVDGVWRVRNIHGHFDTSDTWTLSLHDVDADNSKQALEAVNKSVSSLRFAYGPQREYGKWYCSYYSTWGDVAVWYGRENQS